MSPANAHKSARSLINGKLVYVVDDDAQVVKSLCALLRAYGFQTQGCMSAREFLAVFQRGQTCCLITDLQMPEIDGLELLDRIGKLKEPIGIIVTSGHVSISKAVAILKHGAVALLEKPFEPAELVRAVESAFERVETANDVTRPESG